MAPEQLEALQEIKQSLWGRFDIRTFILYRSVARGQAMSESDVDLLIVTAQPLESLRAA